MAKLNTDIKAFTVFETIVAIVVVMIAFVLSTIVIINVTSSGVSREQQKAYSLVKKVRNESIHQNRFIDETIELEDLMIEKTILDYQRDAELKVMLIECFKGEKKIVESKDLVVVKLEE